MIINPMGPPIACKMSVVCKDITAIPIPMIAAQNAQPTRA